MAVTLAKQQINSGAKRGDNQGRIELGAGAIGKEFNVEVNDRGQIILTPMGQIPEEEAWLYRNPEAMALFQQGLAEAAAGNVTAPKDYSQYADIDIDDES